MKYLIDPPEGWRYGFPREIDITEKRNNQWWLDNGYPQSLIDKGMLEWVRIISMPEDETEKNKLESF